MADSSSSLVLDSIEPHRFDVLSISEKEVLYKHLYDFIDLMDEACISELFSGNLSDIDKIYQVLLEENYNILSLKKVTPILTLDSVPHLKSGYEDYLRRANLNYFTQSVLPHFEMNWHNIEWFNMVQLYRLLCIMAARDHCFGEGTRIRMFDGSLKNVEDIVEGDLVMGPDSSPRKVLSLHRGIDQLYQVRQTRGDSYIVNSQHILSGYSPHFYDDKKVKRPAKSIEVSVEKFLSYSKDKKSSFRGYKVSIDYPYQEVLLEPYFLGLWLGDGTASNQCVTTIDSEIVQYLESYSKRLGGDYYCDYNSRGSFDCWIRTRKVGRGHKHSLLKGLREYNLIDNKHIPQKYLLNSVEVRRQLLAGLIDSDGSISDNICYYTTISEVLANDIRELCYSLGFRVTLRKNESFIKSLQRRYITYELIISGLLDKIPTLLKRKQVRFNGKGSSYYTPEPIHDYPVSLISSLQVESIGRGKYFGFECDGDHRFLLEDSTVVHNSKSYSFSFAYILWRLYRYAKPTSLVTPPDDIKFYKEGMLITNEFKLAKKLLKKVKQEIESNEVLREALLPTKNSGGWANESLTCKNGSEITLSSFRTSNRGPHPGWIVVDDFLDKSAIYSKEQREKFMEVFNAEIMNMILPQGQVLVVGCVGLDTIVLTKGGFRYMKDLAPESENFKEKKIYDKKIEVLDKFGWSSTSKYFVNGFGLMKSIVLQGGYSLRCSLVHPLYRMGESGFPVWTKSSELRVGDWVGLRKNNSDFGSPISLKDFKESQTQYCYNIKCLDLPDYLDEDLAYLMGLWIAEGSIYLQNNSVEISTGDSQIIDFLYSLELKYGIRFKKSAEFSYLCVSKNLVKFFSFMGLIPTHCNEKAIPSQLICAEKKVLRNLLSGIFDGDGSCCLCKDDDLQVSLSSTSGELVRSIQSILLMGWGIKSILGEASVDRLRENLREGDFNCNFSQFTLSLHGNNAITFCKEISFRLSRKQEKFLDLERSYKNRDLVPFQYQLYDSINRKRISQKIFYDKRKPKSLEQFYQKRQQVAISKQSLLEVIDYWSSLGIQSDELSILKSNCDSDIIWVPIKSIEDIQGCSVDFVIPETNSFITNGIISHNTPFHEKDLYANLKEARNWRVFEYPAVFPDGSLLWENRYNFQALMDKRVSLGAMIFSREILVRPISDSVSIFPWSILETSFIGMEKYTLVENLISFPVKFKKVAAGVDLAISGNVGADYMVIIVVGLDELNRIWLLHMTRLHGAGYNEQIATLQRINHSFNPSVILMETNGFQKIMSQLSRDNGINNIVEFTTTGNNKKDAYEGLPSLAVLFERGEFKFPRGDEKSRELTNLLCGELNSVAFDDDRGKLESVGEHDDTAMGLFFATKALKYISNDIFLSMI